MIRLVVVMASALVTAQCSPSGSGEGGGSYVCDTRPEKPRVEQLAQGPVVIARSESVCDVPPDTHKVTLRLEMRVGKQGWEQQYTNVVEPFGICEPIPAPRATCEYVIFKCAEGVWRTRVTVSGTGRDAKGLLKSFFFEVPEKPEASIKCGKK
jgi:hypothetical protein